MGSAWTITGNQQAGTFEILGQECIKVNVEMPVGKGHKEGVDWYIPKSQIDSSSGGGEGAENVYTLKPGTTVFRTVLQPVLLGETVGPTAIPASAPAEAAWNFVGTLALPAS